MVLEASTRPALTQRQLQILRFVDERIRQDGLPPTRREIADHCGIASPNGSHQHVNVLIIKGYLGKRPNTARGLYVIGEVPDDDR